MIVAQKLFRFANKIDAQTYNYIRFTLTSLDLKEDDVEISVDYGISKENPAMFQINVWARFVEGNVKGFVCDGTVPRSKVEKNGFIEIARTVHDSPVFQEGLGEFLSWAIQHHAMAWE